MPGPVLLLIAGVIMLAIGTASWVTTVGLVLTILGAVGTIIALIVTITAGKFINGVRKDIQRDFRSDRW